MVDIPIEYPKKDRYLYSRFSCEIIILFSIVAQLRNQNQEKKKKQSSSVLVIIYPTFHNNNYNINPLLDVNLYKTASVVKTWCYVLIHLYNPLRACCKLLLQLNLLLFSKNMTFLFWQIRYELSVIDNESYNLYCLHQRINRNLT